ncbi:MAG: hypothetical protein R2685_04995 [Candidatus Nitrosocosmicus sp.]|nr:hypothetical protein [Candidatus Nitrosocosmicus sp.]
MSQSIDQKKIHPDTDAQLISENKKAMILFETLLFTDVYKVIHDLETDPLVFETKRITSGYLLYNIKDGLPIQHLETLEIILSPNKDHVEVIFIYIIKNEDKKKSFQEIQKAVEDYLPETLKGVYLNNAMNCMLPKVLLPSLYIYDTSSYDWILTRPYNEFWGIPTDRDILFDFCRSFNKASIYEEEENVLERLVDSSPLACIAKRILVFRPSEYLFSMDFSIPSNFVCLFFVKFDLDMEAIQDFIMQFSLCFNLLAILGSSIVKINIPKLIDVTKIQRNEMRSFRNGLIKKRIALNLINSVIAIDFWEEFNSKDTFFYEEDEYINQDRKSVKATNTLNALFKNRIANGYKKYNEIFKTNYKLLEEYITFIQEEEKIERPNNTSLFKGLETEYSDQVIKWRDRIDEPEITQWLLNFDTNKEKLLALRLLDNLRYLTEKNLTYSVKALYNRIIRVIGTNKVIYSNIGDIKNGSMTIVKTFMDVNKIGHKKVRQFSSLNSYSNPDTVLILIDDFIGSGNTFIKWYNQNTEGLMNFKTVYFASLLAVDTGISNIKNITKIETICSLPLNDSDRIFSSNDFTDQEKKDIRVLIERYKSIQSKEFIYGFDNSQLLLAFEKKVPNNTIALLWADQNGWTPLLKRKSTS